MTPKDQGFDSYSNPSSEPAQRLDLLGELAAQLEGEHGAVSEEVLAEARRSWPAALGPATGQAKRAK